MLPRMKTSKASKAANKPRSPRKRAPKLAWFGALVAIGTVLALVGSSLLPLLYGP